MKFAFSQNQIKRVYGSLILMMLPFLFGPSLHAIEPSDQQLLDDLSAQITQMKRNSSSQPMPLLSPIDMKVFHELPAPFSGECKETYSQRNSDLFVTTFDAQGSPCRIVRINYPNYKLLKDPFGIVSIPLKTPPIIAFTHALAGDWEKVRQDVAVSKPSRDLLDKSPVLQRLAPNETRSIAELFPDFKPTANLKDQFATFAQLKNQAHLVEVATPEDLFKNITITHNLEKQSLDINFQNLLNDKNAATLIDFTHPLNNLWGRTTLETGRQLTAYLAATVPDPVIGGILLIALNDYFDFIEQTFDYEIFRLEAVLKLNLRGTLVTKVEAPTLLRALDLLYIHRNNTLFAWAMGLLKKKELTFARLETQAAETRLATEATRSKSVQTQSEFLRTHRNCIPQPLFDYFAICDQGQKGKYIFTLSAPQDIWFIKFGPTLLYDFQYPAHVFMDRSALYLLSVASRILVPLPLLIKNWLWALISVQMHKGWLEEAYFTEFLKASRAQRPFGPHQPSLLDTLEPEWLNRQQLDPLQLFTL